MISAKADQKSGCFSLRLARMFDFIMTKKMIRLVLIVLSTRCFAEPNSGFIHRVTYKLDEKGVRTAVPQDYKTWFTKSNTRKETCQHGEVTAIYVTGEHWWNAYPRIKRLERYSPPPWGFRSFREEVSFFAKRLANREPVAEEMLTGFPCRKFSWHDPGQTSGCIRIPAHDVTCWAYANDDFPIALRYESTFGLSSEISQMKLDCEVPAELFEAPGDLRLIRPLRIPTRDFTIEITERRSSSEYGWREQTRHQFVGKGKTVHYALDKTTVSSRAEESVRSSEKELSVEEALAQLAGLLRSPYWAGVVKAAQASSNGKIVDIYVPDSMRRALEEKYWVLDHPDLGTITIKRTEKTQNHVIEVNRIRINDEAERNKQIGQTDSPGAK